jgi:hypothetical protein
MAVVPGSKIYPTAFAESLGLIPIFGASTSVTGQIKAWISSFVAKPVKAWNGSAFVVKPLKRWSGSAWVTTPY